MKRSYSGQKNFMRRVKADRIGTRDATLQWISERDAELMNWTLAF
jgi:hypothetical protein